MLWIAITLFAACAQGVRTGLQKHLAETVDKTTANFARYIFGLPLLLAILLLEYFAVIDAIIASAKFYWYCALLAGLQLFGTLMMLMVFKRKNYMLGVAFARTEAVLVALFGFMFFSAPLPANAVAAVVCGVVGVLLLSNINLRPRSFNLMSSLRGGTFLIGIASGSAFALTAWFIRLANNELETNLWLAPLYTLGVSNVMQISTVLLIAALSGRWRSCWGNIFAHRKLVTGVGLMSILGSWGWFTAYSLAHPAYVKTVGQTEMLVVYFISRKMFRERLSLSELLGICLIVVSIFILYAL